MWNKEEIKAFRLRLQLSQSDFAQLLGVTREYITYLETGVRTPSDTFQRLLECLEFRYAKQKSRGGQAMKRLKTLTKNRFFGFKECQGGELIVYPDSEGEPQNKRADVITPFTINLVKNAIKKKGEILMGASRHAPSRGSLGEMLQKEGKSLSPQLLSYLIPILLDSGYCDYGKEGGAFLIRYRK